MAARFIKLIWQQRRWPYSFRLLGTWHQLLTFPQRNSSRGRSRGPRGRSLELKHRWLAPVRRHVWIGQSESFLFLKSLFGRLFRVNWDELNSLNSFYCLQVKTMWRGCWLAPVRRHVWISQSKSFFFSFLKLFIHRLTKSHLLVQVHCVVHSVIVNWAAFFFYHWVH